MRSNRDVESGRVYIIVLDDLNVAPLRTNIVRRHAREFIEQRFGPRDLAAVVVTSGRKDAAQEFTSDPALLLRAVDSFFGQRLVSAEMQRIENYYTNQLSSSDPDLSAGMNSLDPIVRNQSFDPSNLERGQRAVGVLNTLESLSEYLEGVRGRRKALLWFSEGIDYPMAETFSSQSGNEIITATRNVVNAAARANVNIYALDPRGLIGMTTDFVENMRAGAPDRMGTDPTRPVGTPFSGTQALIGEMRLTQDSLRTLSEGTGGFAAVDTNSFVEAYERINDANSRYYLLGYTPPQRPRDGRFHRIEVRIKRPGLTAVARRGYPSSSGPDARRAPRRSAEPVGARPPRRWRERYDARAARGPQQRRAAIRADARRAGRAVQGAGQTGRRGHHRRTGRPAARVRSAAERSLRRFRRGLVLRAERRWTASEGDAGGAESGDQARDVSAPESARYPPQLANGPATRDGTNCASGRAIRSLGSRAPSSPTSPYPSSPRNR